jgi:adenylate kinase family enzyme
MPCMEKIVVIGSAGAGKSTFARQLGAKLDIEVLHLDCYFWDPDWREKSPSERKEIQHTLMKKDRWIIEGTYLSTSEERLGAADWIIFLDINVLICFWRIIKRRIQNHNKNRLDLPVGCTEKLHWTYILKVLVFPLRGRRHLFQKRKKLMKVKNVNFTRLSSPKRVELFLQKEAVNQQSTINEFTEPGKVQDYTDQRPAIRELAHV